MTYCFFVAALFFSSFSNFSSLTIDNPPQFNTIEKEIFQVSRLSSQGQAAYQNLLNAERFEDAFIGEAGSYSGFVKNFNELLKEKHADEAFKSLLNEAKIAGQLYALSGLFYTDNDFFKKAVEKYRKNTSEVGRMSGCEIFTAKVNELVESVSPDVAIVSPNETMEDFWKRNKKSYEVDIFHGGFPATFRAAKSRNDKKSGS